MVIWNCDLACQSQAKLMRFDIIEKESEFSFDMIYYLCFYALSIQSNSNQEKL